MRNFYPNKIRLKLNPPKRVPSTIITTHINADFDAIASALAAKKLHPEGIIVLPGSQSKGTREFIVNSASYILDPVRISEVDLSKVTRLIIVDTKNPERIDKLAELAKKPDIEVIIYDHHPPTSNDIKADKLYYKPTGANTTMMLELIRKRGIEISRDEASILAMGIYEDTGSFNFASTTPNDLIQAAWLLEKGADINTISEVLSNRLTPEHISVLNDLLQNAKTFTKSGVQIVIASTSITDYLEDFAVLLREIMDMKKIPVIFALALMQNRVLIVARSRDERLNVGKILEVLGGGGHTHAASVNLKNITLEEAEKKLIRAIERHWSILPRAKDFMATPVISIGPDTTIEQAHDKLTEFGFTALPVVDKTNKVQGIISRNIIERAIKLGVKKHPVSDYMTTRFVTISPDDPLQVAQDLIVLQNQRLVPVEENDHLVGVITRTGLLEIFTETPGRRSDELLHFKGRRRNVAALLKERLDSYYYDILITAGKVASEIGVKVYVVGGFVRDLLLRRPNLDIDLVVEGDGIVFAKALSKAVNGRIRAHKKFHTATVIFPNDFRVDVASARLEYYKYPAALPTVLSSSIKLDLYRRDFTINTLAVSLTPDDFGTLIDYFGGQRDIKDRVIRVLHGLSFIEDPTRVFRAVRFEQRYKFRIDKHTLNLIRNAAKLDIFARLSGPRLLSELIHILEETNPIPALKRMVELNLLNAISPLIRLTPNIEQLLNNTYESLTWYRLLFKPLVPKKWLVYFLALTDGLAEKDLYDISEDLGITGKERTILLYGRENARKSLALLTQRHHMADSEIYWLLKGHDIELLLYMIAKAYTRQARQAVSRYITELADTKPIITGKDLLTLGIKPGPIFKTILNRLIEARLNGEVQDKKDEIALVKKEFKQLLPIPTTPHLDNSDMAN